ncbi:MAG: hypothetical protein FWD49_07515 [Firmicutes bacterium]|nr:hypothetical protein [Bacillota bacterium]
MKIKKTFSILLAVIICACLCAVLFACGNDLPDNSEGVTVTLIVQDINGNELYNMELLTFKSALSDSFIEFEGLNVKGNQSYLGLYITTIEVGYLETVIDEEWGDYDIFVATATLNPVFPTVFAVYHNINDIKYKDIPEKKRTVNGETFYYSGVGVSHLPLFNGATYILTLEIYGG